MTLHRAPIAAIDVGTNSVLLLIARPQPEGGIEVLTDEAHITRIGEGIGADNLFQPAAMDRTLAILAQYATQCREAGVERIIAVGTAAFRRVTNGQQFSDRVRRTCGIALDVISGTREATLSHHAAARDFGDDLLVCDVGGGSTEYIWCASRKSEITAISLPLGSVALQEKYCHSDPISPADYEMTRAAIVSELHSHLGEQHGGGAGLTAGRLPGTLIALAGSATTLAAMHLQLREYNHWQVHGTILTAIDIEALVATLRARTLAERKQLPGLEPGRADVILPGAMILLETMQMLRYDRVTISDRGVRWGLVYEQLEN